MKKSLSNLLKKLEESQVYNNENISSLNDALSKSMKKGGYATTNLTCGSSNNSSCENWSCKGGLNNSCLNHSCII